MHQDDQETFIIINVETVVLLNIFVDFSLINTKLNSIYLKNKYFASL